MAWSLSPNSSASKNVCNSANVQTTIDSYFLSRSDGPKRKRRNVQVPSSDSGNTDKLATTSVAQNEENDSDEQLFCLQDDCTSLKVESMQCSSGSNVCCSSQQLDSDSPNIIPPSPAANSRIALIGKMKRNLDHCVDSRLTDAADCQAAALPPISVPDVRTSFSDCRSTVQPSCNAQSSELLLKLKSESDRLVKSRWKSADDCCESDDTELVASSQLSSAHIAPSAESVTMNHSLNVLSVASTANDSSENVSLLSFRPSTRRRFVEKVLLPFCHFRSL